MTGQLMKTTYTLGSSECRAWMDGYLDLEMVHRVPGSAEQPRLKQKGKTHNVVMDKDHNDLASAIDHVLLSEM